jgi:Zn-dependent membrane protease YugP
MNEFYYTGLFSGGYGSFILLIPAMIFAFYAQAKVGSTFKKYLRVKSRKGLTGAQAARRILDSNGLTNVPIQMIGGRLSDHYDPRKRVVSLSPDVYNSSSIASISVAAHEIGHAIQHSNGYAPLVVRNTIAPVVSVVSNLAWPLALIGLAMGSLGLFDLGILFYTGAVLFQAVTLPVEFNASRRAVTEMEALGIIDKSERKSAKKVLSAAAMTYVAAMAVAIANLLRLLVLRGSRD